MNALEKLLRRVSPHDKVVLAGIIRALTQGETQGFQIEKLSGTDLYKMRKGNFRFVIHYENTVPIIKAVRLRNEKTYKYL